MNKISQDIPNLIKQPSQCCIYCGKGYKKKTNLEKHIVLCELINRSTKRNGLLIDDEEETIPSQKKMFHMLLELGNRFSKLEEKVEEINKVIVKKKKKINVVEWLNTNMKPNIKFNNLIEKITITEDDVKNIFEKSFLETLNHIFSRNIYNFDEEYPIFAFIQKSNVFYIYENDDEKWSELSKEKMIKFLNKVHMKLLRAYGDYKKLNSDKIRNDESFSILCDKISIKLMNVDFRQESTLGKIRTNMYSRMKSDMKGLVEYEFEF
jgi:hypothetical protein